jgi:hypothetical protein
MGKINIEICQILYTIYDFYQERSLTGVWKKYKRIIKTWIAQNEKKYKLEENV